MENVITHNKWKGSNDVATNNVTSKDVIKNEFNDFEFVDVKIRAFIPSEIIYYVPEGLGFIDDNIIDLSFITDYGYGGDNRTFSYDKGTSRFELFYTLDLHPNTNPILSNFKDWGTTTKYLIDDLSAVDNFPNWYWKKKSIDISAVESGKLSVNESNMMVDVERIPSYDGNNLSNIEAQFKIEGANPLIPGSPPINAFYKFYFVQKEDGLYFKYFALHDLFPAHEVYLNRKLIHSHDPVKDRNSPNDLFGLQGQKLKDSKQLVKV